MTQKEIIKNYLRSVWLENPDQWVVGFKMEGKELLENGQVQRQELGAAIL